MEEKRFFNWIVQLYEPEFFSIEELEGSYSPLNGVIPFRVNYTSPFYNGENIQRNITLQYILLIVYWEK